MIWVCLSFPVCTQFRGCCDPFLKDFLAFTVSELVGKIGSYFVVFTLGSAASPNGPRLMYYGCQLDLRFLPCVNTRLSRLRVNINPKVTDKKIQYSFDKDKINV